MLNQALLMHGRECNAAFMLQIRAPFIDPPFINSQLSLWPLRMLLPNEKFSFLCGCLDSASSVLH